MTRRLGPRRPGPSARPLSPNPQPRLVRQRLRYRRSGLEKFQNVWFIVAGQDEPGW